jgi:hypothetical protein
MEWWFFWLVLAGVIGAVAAARNRSGFGWFVIAVLISPLLAGLVLALLGRGDAGVVAVTAATHRQCTECREWVRRDARLCKHCRSKLDPIT